MRLPMWIQGQCRSHRWHWRPPQPSSIQTKTPAYSKRPRILLWTSRPLQREAKQKHEAGALKGAETIVTISHMTVSLRNSKDWTTTLKCSMCVDECYNCSRRQSRKEHHSTVQCTRFQNTRNAETQHDEQQEEFTDRKGCAGLRCARTLNLKCYVLS